MPVMSCNCVSKQQDEIHGPGQRVFNRTAKQDGKEYRCTVCCATKVKGGSSDEGKKKKK